MQIKIIIGSKSDFDPVRPALDLAKQLGLDCDVSVASAHRSPDRVHEVVAASERCGTKVFIAAAGGAAHLAGAVKSRTIRPVVGVPVETKLAGGLDSLLSTLQMPSGVPVATVGVNNFRNAVLLAAEIIALSDEELSDRLKHYKRELEDSVCEQNAIVREAIARDN